MALARALAVEPKVLLLDEPFGALDAKVRKELRDWLRRLHDEVHVTTVFVTHDQEEALEVADEIVVINEGRIEQVGTPDELYDSPANDFVMGFLGPVTRLGAPGAPARPATSPPRTASGVAGRVTRVARIGFEIRVEVTTAGGQPVTVTLTRNEFQALNIQLDSEVRIRPTVTTPTGPHTPPPALPNPPPSPQPPNTPPHPTRRADLAVSVAGLPSSAASVPTKSARSAGAGGGGGGRGRGRAGGEGGRGWVGQVLSAPSFRRRGREVALEDHEETIPFALILREVAVSWSQVVGTSASVRPALLHGSVLIWRARVEKSLGAQYSLPS